ncbi:SirB2 family protein [Balneatrix alpica]|uniref:SirB2 family protein n=1 Tax=Balneatrix alpica TaxID=75684 RepID=UPI0027398B18|nr:SirB2 family protein [Balneatrix alpica]
MYFAFKHLHLSLVAASILFFCIRAGWMLLESSWLQRPWVRILPHIIDTFLLLSAIGLMLMLQQYPLTHAWLTAKVLGLFAYIGFGTFAIKRGKNRHIRTFCLIGALLSLYYMASVAIHKSPWPFAGA